MTPRVCIWTSGFQADTQALTHALASAGEWEVTVALLEPARYSAEAVNRILPLPVRFVDRGAGGAAAALRREGYDLLVVDNHLPDTAIAPRIFVLWHGLGWRVDDISAMRKELGRLVGDVRKPNARFRWQAFGPWDRDYRITHSHLAPENVVALGSAYSDLLLPGSALLTRIGSNTPSGGGPTDDRSRLRALIQDAYPIDLRRKTILVGLTWHHGAALSQWGEDAELLRRLFDHAERRDANILLRMHDRHRFTPEYLATVERAAAGRPNVHLTFKSDHPDSLVDLLVSDVLISNYSSLLNAYYYSRKPSVHLDPNSPGQTSWVYRRWQHGKLRERRVQHAAEVWKLSPGEIGGLRARSFTETLALVDRSLAFPDCCVNLARDFTDRYVTGVNGHTGERILAFLAAWITGLG